MKDAEMQQRLMDANPNSFRKFVATMLEANGRGAPAPLSHFFLPPCARLQCRMQEVPFLA